jgi:adenosine deaminase
MPIYRRSIPAAALATLLLLCFAASHAAKSPPAPTSESKSEAHAAAAFRAASGNTGTLRAFLVRMPKGADLHMHLAGSIYAETLLRDAAADGLCFDVVSQSLIFPEAKDRQCVPGTQAAELPQKQVLYDGLIDSFSMRNFIPTTLQSGHDHFFAAFSKYGAVSKLHRGEWLDEVAARAAAQNEQYLEVMETLDDGHGAGLGLKLGLSLPDHAGDSDFAAARNKLLAANLREGVTAAGNMLDQAEAQRRQLEQCDSKSPAPACAVTIRLLFQVLRGIPRDAVFSQTLLAFEFASADPRVVGINCVQPEDAYASMHDYALQMRWLGWFHQMYPKVHISLHAGELAPGLVPPNGLRDHVRLAVEQAHAERIGHGVDVLWEDNAGSLLKEMAAKHVMVEINLTSNDVILNVKGRDHPLPVYRAYHVPVALSTDDEGVSRIDLTHEYIRAAQEYNLSYADLKQMARTGVAHTFLPGNDLWQQPDNFSATVSACAADKPVSNNLSAKCADFLKRSQHATQEWQLERRFRAFEATF